jgi:hypothetical protein
MSDGIVHSHKLYSEFSLYKRRNVFFFYLMKWTRGSHICMRNMLSVQHSFNLCHFRLHFVENILIFQLWFFDGKIWLVVLLQNKTYSSIIWPRPFTSTFSSLYCHEFRIISSFLGCWIVHYQLLRYGTALSGSIFIRLQTYTSQCMYYIFFVILLYTI